ncbi:unnamed protein product [Ectocarpus sp. 8 AP-2014]
MNESVSTHTPLIPMSEMFGSNTNENGDSHSRQPMEQQQQKSSQRASLTYVLEIIESELGSLAKIQTSNNEEIKKRLTEIQSYRESNLVVVGAISGLKKIREKI